MSSRMSADGFHIPLPPQTEEASPLWGPAPRAKIDPQAYGAAFRDGLLRAAEIARTAPLAPDDDGHAPTSVEHAKETISRLIQREANG
jgi:hypothetical protein